MSAVNWLEHAVGRSDYQPIKVVGRGSYGTVWSCTRRKNNTSCALKKVKALFDVKLDTIRVLRELQFLRLLRHPNVIHATDVLRPTDRSKYNEVNIVFDLFDTDLASLIRSPTVYGLDHARWIFFQLLHALRYLHRLNIFHRDIKPGNILLNADCDVKLCDFGLARAKVTGSDTMPMFWSDYVCSRWYRAPELICCHTARNAGGVDMWSAGCILAELFTRRPLFRGGDSAGQLREICTVAGHPSQKMIDGVTSASVREYLEDFEEQERVSLKSVVPQADDVAHDLLLSILTFDPAERFDAEQALEHEFFCELSKLPAASRIEDFCAATPPPNLELDMQASSSLQNMSVAALRECIYREIMMYHELEHPVVEASEPVQTHAQENRPERRVQFPVTDSTNDAHDMDVSCSPHPQSSSGDDSAGSADSTGSEDKFARRMSCTAAREPVSGCVHAEQDKPVMRTRSHSDHSHQMHQPWRNPTSPMSPLAAA